ncbi:MAG: putative sulfate exporter family transporter [Verrucomicrobia bacterium]|nr:putative sulfate exporter family transporter [Verrucomicrobiota bacterium]
MTGRKPLISEDWLALWTGVAVFLLSLGVFAGTDLLGFGAKVGVWTDISKAITPVSGAFKWMSAGVSVLSTFLFMGVVIGTGNWLLGGCTRKFVIAFTLVFGITFACHLLGSQANIAATTPAELKKFGITWSLKLTGEAGFVLALLAGLAIGNFFPRLAALLKEAVRPELFVKTAIVIMGAGVGIKALENSGLAWGIMFRGFCAIVEAYLIYWAVMYYIARKFFKFNREWAAPLASGISICGVSAAIATGGAIRARPIVPIMVSSLVVVFAVVELLLLPFLAQAFLWQEPLVAGAWMGLAVKTDGAATAAGAVTDALILAKAAANGVFYEKDWILNTATSIKVFIDIFIGIWAFVLAYIWANYIEKREGDKVRVIEIWQRFPKFVIGYLLTFLIFLGLGIAWPSMVKSSVTVPVTKEQKVTDPTTGKEKMEMVPVMKEVRTEDPATGQVTISKVAETKQETRPGPARLATDQSNVFRVLFFCLTFFTIGVVSNFRKLWEEGIGRLAAVYVVGLFGFIIWFGLVISWLFFGGVHPPIVH